MRTMSDSKAVRNTRVVYVLYYVGAFFWPVMIVGGIYAYILRDKVSNSLAFSHLRKQIQIFWIYLVIGVGGGIAIVIICIFVLLLILAGILVVEWITESWVVLSLLVSSVLLILHTLGLLIYVFVATTKGLMKLNDDEPIHAESLLFGFGGRQPGY